MVKGRRRAPKFVSGVTIAQMNAANRSTFDIRWRRLLRRDPRIFGKEGSIHMSRVIVFGVDGSETARKAAEAARDLATALGATLHVVSAFDADRAELFASGRFRWLVSDADKAEHVCQDRGRHPRRRHQDHALCIGRQAGGCPHQGSHS
ncbi:hypothetical protein GCM10023346_22300 [Arthrobacter gyeryongensis]|uniref:UspA domain-containing protein n=1 Tax=Arthrobacter gyeryongensis TaxID=1650592 RepID=A0ABP9SFH5_9MICC